jgi:hypothetical protein
LQKRDIKICGNVLPPCSSSIGTRYSAGFILKRRTNCVGGKETWWICVGFLKIFCGRKILAKKKSRVQLN